MHHIKTDRKTLNRPLSIIALILGYTFWHIYSDYVEQEVSFSIPISFYEIDPEQDYSGPDSVTVNLYGKNQDLRRLDSEILSVHINARTLKDGNNSIFVTPELMFLPTTIKMVDCTPSPVTVTCTSRYDKGNVLS